MMNNEKPSIWNKQKHKEFFNLSKNHSFILSLFFFSIFSSSLFLLSERNDSVQNEVIVPVGKFLADHDKYYKEKKNEVFYIDKAPVKMKFISEKEGEIVIKKENLHIFSLIDKKDSENFLPIPKSLTDNKDISKLTINGVDYENIKNNSYNDNMKKYFSQDEINIKIFFK